MNTAAIAARLPDLFQPPATAKVYSYARFSTPEQAKGDSFRRQTEAAARWAARRNLALDEALSIRDEGVSAYRGTNALDGGLSRFLQACRRGLIEPGSFLLVESLDRISRMAPRKAQRLLDDIVDADVTIVTLNDDQEYTSDRLDNDPTALLIALMVSWRAHEESKTKGRRVAAAWAEKRRRVAAGEVKRLTTKGPSWLLPDGEGWREDGPKADIVRRIFALTLQGEGEHKIAKLFNSESVPLLGRGIHWHRSTVSKMLRNPAVIGTLIPGSIRYEGGRKVRHFEEPVANAYPTIITDADWLAVRAMKDGHAAAVRGRHAGKGVAHLLAGLAKCPTCRSAMIRVSKGDPAKGGRPKLVCSKAKVGAGCPYISVPVHKVDDAIVHSWGSLFESVPAGTGNDDLDEAYRRLSADIAGTEDVLAELTEDWDRKPTAAGARRVSRVEAELQVMRSELEAIDERRRQVDRGLIRSRLDDLGDLFREAEENEHPIDFTHANAAMKVLFAEVTVDHRQGELRFHWRQGGESCLRYAWVD